MSQAFRVYPYLRASTKDQNASRALESIQAFAKTKSINLSQAFIENISGTKLDRPELNRLLEIAEKGDIILVEGMDRLSRLTQEDWTRLQGKIRDIGVDIVALNLPTSHLSLEPSAQSWTSSIISNLFLEMAVATAREDYETRRRRAAEGTKLYIEKCKSEGRKPFKGRQESKELMNNVADYLNIGKSYSWIQEKLGCSSRTIAKVSKRIKNDEPVYQTEILSNKDMNPKKEVN